jgi:putative hydrolase of the HAD superfamily
MGELRPESIRGILLDYYGTIAEAPGLRHEANVRVVVDALNRQGIAVGFDAFYPAYRSALERHLRIMRKGPETRNAEWVADALAGLGQPIAAADPRVQGAVREYFDTYAAQIRCYPDAVEALPRLAARWPLGLVSNFTDALPVRVPLERDGIAGAFRAMTISIEVGFRKPHPRIFEAALAALGLHAGEVLFVGDDPVEDVEGARRMGMATARVARGTRTPLYAFLSMEEESDPEEADIVVADLTELADRLLGRG